MMAFQLQRSLPNSAASRVTRSLERFTDYGFQDAPNPVPHRLAFIKKLLLRAQRSASPPAKGNASTPRSDKRKHPPAIAWPATMEPMTTANASEKKQRNPSATRSQSQFSTPGRDNAGIRLIAAMSAVIPFSAGRNVFQTPHGASNTKGLCMAAARHAKSQPSLMRAAWPMARQHERLPPVQPVG